MMEGNLLFSKSMDLHVNHIQKHLIETAESCLTKHLGTVTQPSPYITLTFMVPHTALGQDYTFVSLVPRPRDIHIDPLRWVGAKLLVALLAL